MRSDPSRCQPRTLAHEGNVRVDLCGCGQVHVTLGPFTVRLDRSQYLLLCDALLAGARALPDANAGALH